MLENKKISSKKIVYWTAGEGTALLFAHGFPFDHTMWLPAAEILSKSARLILPDLRGFGESANPTKNAQNMSDFADDLAALLLEEGIQKVVFCGLSMGGYIAGAFAEKYPEKLAGVILCDTKTQADTPQAAAKRRILADTVLDEGTDLLADGAAGLLSPETVEQKPEIVDFLQEMMTRQDAEGVAAASLGMALRRDTTAALQRLSVPILVVGGEDDRLTPPESMQELADSLKNTAFVSIKNAGHLTPLECPDAFAQSVSRWLAKNF